MESGAGHIQVQIPGAREVSGPQFSCLSKKTDDSVYILGLS